MAGKSDQLGIAIFWSACLVFLGLGALGSVMYLGLSIASVILGCIMGFSLWFFLIIMILLLSF